MSTLHLDPGQEPAQRPEIFPASVNRSIEGHRITGSLGWAWRSIVGRGGGRFIVKSSVTSWDGDSQPLPVNVCFGLIVGFDQRRVPDITPLLKLLSFCSKDQLSTPCATTITKFVASRKQ